LKNEAEELSRLRVTAAKDLGNRITAELSSLSMPNASVEVSVEQLDTNSISSYAIHGIDEITFQFSPHTGSKLMPLAKIASGGEMSRLMLAIEVVIAAESPVGTYVSMKWMLELGEKQQLKLGVY